MKPMIDLTRTLRNGMAVYPGTPAPCFVPVSTIKEDGFCETSLFMYSHVGTHMDAPAHMMDGGKTLDGYAPERFFGKGAVVDLCGFAADQSVGWESLSIHEKEAIAACDILLFDTGFDTDQDARRAYAVPAEDVLHKAIQHGVRTVGIDRMSIDRMNATDMPLHRLLFAHDVLVLENLQGLSALHGTTFFVSALPLLYTGADGAPARVIAWKT